MEGVLLECPRAWERLLPPGIRRAETAVELEGRDWDLLALTVGGCAAVAERKVQCRILLLPGSWEQPLPPGLTAETVISYGPFRPGQSHALQPDGAGAVHTASAAPAGRRAGGTPGIFAAGAAGTGGSASAPVGRTAVADPTGPGSLCMVS